MTWFLPKGCTKRIRLAGCWLSLSASLGCGLMECPTSNESGGSDEKPAAASAPVRPAGYISPLAADESEDATRLPAESPLSWADGVDPPAPDLQPLPPLVATEDPMAPLPTPLPPPEVCRAMDPIGDQGAPDDDLLIIPVFSDLAPGMVVATDDVCLEAPLLPPQPSPRTPADASAPDNGVGKLLDSIWATSTKDEPSDAGACDDALPAAAPSAAAPSAAAPSAAAPSVTAPSEGVPSEDGPALGSIAASEPTEQVVASADGQQLTPTPVNAAEWMPTLTLPPPVSEMAITWPDDAATPKSVQQLVKSFAGKVVVEAQVAEAPVVESTIDDAPIAESMADEGPVATEPAAAIEPTTVEPVAIEPGDVEPTPVAETRPTQAPTESRPSLHPVATGVPTGTIIQKQATAKVRRGYALAQRGAYFSARAEFIGVLHMLAQAKDHRSGEPRRSNALSRGLRALDEAADFAPRGGALAADVDLSVITSSHRTPATNGDVLLLPQQLMDRYFRYAQLQLGAAVAGEPAGSMALHALGKLHSQLGRVESEQHPLADRYAYAYQQAALFAHDGNHLAAHELGVLMAQSGHLQEAEDLLQQVAAREPHPQVLLNLVKVQTRLGRTDAAAQTRAAAQQTRARYASTNGIYWVAPSAFARAGQTHWNSPNAPAARMAGNPQ